MILLYLAKLPRHSSLCIITKSEADISLGQHHPLASISISVTWLITPVLSDPLCCESWFYLLAEILPLVWTLTEWLQAFLPLVQLPADISYTEGREPSKTVSTKINVNFASDFTGFRTCLYCPFLSLHKLLHRSSHQYCWVELSSQTPSSVKQAF